MKQTTEVAIAVLETNYSSMSKEIQEIKETGAKTLESLSSLRDFITHSLEDMKRYNEVKFATKTDQENSSKRIDKIEEILGKVNWLVVSTVIAAVLGIVIMASIGK